jgi:lysophospholipase L1-like esterase
MKSNLLLIFLACISISCLRPKSNIATFYFKDAYVYGRHFIEDNKVGLVTTAAHTGIRFDGKRINIVASADENGTAMLQYTLDGKLHTKRMVVQGSKPQIIEINAPDEGRHKLWLYKCTEAITGPLYLHYASGKYVFKIEDRKFRKIEFIGNSITCGAAADTSDVPCGSKSYEWYHNGYMSYAAQVARNLDVNFDINSISGAGIYRNWNSDWPTVPQLYDFTKLSKDSDKWDHNYERSPNLISIGLGTNDFSNGDGIKERKPFDAKVFVNTYVGFVHKLKSLHPKAKIVLIDSPMMDGEAKAKLNNCLSEIKKNIDRSFPSDFPIFLYTFKNTYRSGCTTHPSVAEHSQIAEELLPFYKKVLAEQ